MCHPLYSLSCLIIVYSRFYFLSIICAVIDAAFCFFSIRHITLAIVLSVLHSNFKHVSLYHHPSIIMVIQCHHSFFKHLHFSFFCSSRFDCFIALFFWFYISFFDCLLVAIIVMLKVFSGFFSFLQIIFQIIHSI